MGSYEARIGMQGCTKHHGFFQSALLSGIEALLLQGETRPMTSLPARATSTASLQSQRQKVETRHYRKTVREKGSHYGLWPDPDLGPFPVVPYAFAYSNNSTLRINGLLNATIDGTQSQTLMIQAESKSPASSTPYAGVIIPTCNRANDLIECLHHLENQTCRDFQVIIVDDGSTDSTRSAVEAFQLRASFPLQYLHQGNSGPATARNRAIAALTSPVSILIGDDIFPTSNFVRIHSDYHHSHPEPQAAAVGLTHWCEHGQVVTPFMRWLDQNGIQFAYGDLLKGVAPSWKHFYTSNLSCKTHYLQQNPFHEAFRKAAMEDIELGYRLARKHNLSMAFLPEAIADHLHPTSFRRACRRAIDVGAATHLLSSLWPEHRPQAKGALHRRLLSLFTEPRVVLPTLVTITELTNRLWFPNPLLQRVLGLHSSFGYNREVARSASLNGAPTEEP